MSIGMLIAGALVFNFVITVGEHPEDARRRSWRPTRCRRSSFLLFVNVLLLVLGCFLEGTTIILVILPVLLPTAVALGVDPMHFGVMAIVNIMLGLVTPPYGLLLFMMNKIADVPLRDIVREVMPFLYVMIGALALIALVPGRRALAAAAARLQGLNPRPGAGASATLPGRKGGRTRRVVAPPIGDATRRTSMKTHAKPLDLRGRLLGGAHAAHLLAAGRPHARAPCSRDRRGAREESGRHRVARRLLRGASPTRRRCWRPGARCARLSATHRSSSLAARCARAASRSRSATPGSSRSTTRSAASRLVDLIDFEMGNDPALVRAVRERTRAPARA